MSIHLLLVASNLGTGIDEDAAVVMLQLDLK
jgi:hypothetical protein